MNYRIAVCIKPVPDPKHYDKITIDPVTKLVDRRGIPTIINPNDRNAIEAALQIKEKFGGSVAVFTMAPPNAGETLTEALAMGSDEGYLLTDRAFAGADTFATSYTLAQGIKKVGPFDLVFTGSESADGATTQVPAQLAHWLGLAHVWNLQKFTVADDTVIAQMKIETGYIEYKLAAPALLAVTRAINKPRFTTIMGVMKAKKKPLTVWGREDLELDDRCIGLKGSPTQPGEIFAPEIGRKGVVLEGAPEEIVAQLIAKFRACGVALEAWEVCRVEGGEK